MRCLLFLFALTGFACAVGETGDSHRRGNQLPTPESVKDAPPECGDDFCNGRETCETCPSDCGACKSCGAAPSCTGALALPTDEQITHRTELDLLNNEYAHKQSEGDNQQDASDAGSDSAAPFEPPSVTNCRDAQLRMRLKQITTHKLGEIGTAHIYCVVNASDGATSQITVTTPTKPMADGSEFVWDPSIGILWGGRISEERRGTVEDDLRVTRDNLTITYNCFRASNTAGAKAVFDSVQKAAAEAGGIGGAYGWAFGIASVAAGLVSGALEAAGQDEHVFNQQQTIDKKYLLDLTNRRTWSVRENITQFLKTRDWELTIEAWGCADARDPKPR